MSPQDKQIDLKQIEGIKNLVDEGGYDVEQLLSVLNALNVIKKNDAKKRDQENEEPPENKVFLDKEFVYETRDDVYIYRDNRTKKKGYYVRIYDPKTQKHWSKSLKTTNRMVAMTQAEQIYAEKKGRLNFGVRPVSITCKELVQMYQVERRKELTDIPHHGITHQSFDTLCRHIKYWEEYMQVKGHTNTKLEDIPTELGLTFGLWIKEQKKKANTSTSSRNNYTINHTIAAVKKMYRDIAKHKKYITENEMPMFKYLKVNRETRSRKDVITAEEFTAITKWMNYKYCNEKGITNKERIKRRVWNLAFTIMHYTGCRPSELLKMKWADIRELRTNDKLERKINKILFIPQENSKTGRSRELVAPIGEQLNSLKKWYKQEPFSFECTPDRYVFPRLTLTDIENNIPTTTVAWTKRIKATMEGSERDGVWDSQGRRITLYSSRHYYITEAIMRGVTMNDIALNCGTSIQYIEETYSHITTTMRSKDITQGLGIHSMPEESKRKFVEKIQG